MIEKEITPAQAHFVLEALLRARTVTPARVRKELNRIPQEIEAIESRLAALRGDTVVRRVRRSSNPATQASQELQGRYMGLLRHATPSAKAKARRICVERGREAAVKFLVAHRS